MFIIIIEERVILLFCSEFTVLRIHITVLTAQRLRPYYAEQLLRVLRVRLLKIWHFLQMYVRRFRLRLHVAIAQLVFIIAL